MSDPARNVGLTAWRANRLAGGERMIPEETAVAFTYNGSSYAVMMATPRNLHDFAVGFSLTEGIIERADDIESFEVIEQAVGQDLGLELRMRLAEPRGGIFSERRRYLAGPTGCGLCGIETLEEAMRTSRRITDDVQFAPQDIIQSLGTDAATSQVAGRIIDMARDLGLKTVAEGIETVEQERLLKGLKVDFGQGYLYGHPMPLEELLVLLRGQQAGEKRRLRLVAA